MAGAYLFHLSQTGMCDRIFCQDADCRLADACLIPEATKAEAGG